VGTGGHAEALLSRGATVVGIDQDPESLALAQDRLREFGERFWPVRANFRRLREILENLGLEKVDGILFDLGLSSWHLARPERGFSFQQEGPLDMRMNPENPITAGDLVNGLPERELARILREYGEERYAERIAREIVRSRPLRTTTELARVVARCYPPGRQRIHPATRTFQALRIAVNDELSALTEALPQAVAALRPGGVLCVIAFHSLEDRIVKRFFAEGGTSREVEPSHQEAGATESRGGGSQSAGRGPRGLGPPRCPKFPCLKPLCPRF
jgi:16S rRNA (cytosine1402-N4)-methyltransferase